jgi:molecular chaperone GrpE
MDDKTVSQGEQQASDLQELLEAAQQEAAENHDKYLRALAESENMRKRLQRLCDDRLWQEKKRLLLHLVVLGDRLEEALRYASQDDPVGAGVLMTYQELKKTLKQEGVESFASIGEMFDPNRHEAVELIEDESRHQNEVTSEYQRGYTLEGRLLRPARVEVNRTQ